ncbi:MAG: hypothetical protein H6813_07475 [Phycisphaeraceae bacterium]|nr:hypothetical protein [Phycisphaeraceae bacterium]MCB9848335.1 hypothetical protein [Phycisphaeraceae bacterium]
MVAPAFLRHHRRRGVDPAGPATTSQPQRALTREQLLDRIQSINPSARPEYLVQFRPEALSLYLDHLLHAASPRRPEHSWERPGDTPAIVTRCPGDHPR